MRRSSRFSFISKGILPLASLTLSLGLWTIAAAQAIEESPGTIATIDHISCTGGPHEVQVVVKNVKKSVGLIVADLYRNDNAGFLKRAGRVQQVRFAARAPVTKFCMRAPSTEQYAIALYHDKNANKALDKGAFGIPAEPVGISNNPRLRFAAPDIADTIFPVANDGAFVEIDLKN